MEAGAAVAHRSTAEDAADVEIQNMKDIILVAGHTPEVAQAAHPEVTEITELTVQPVEKHFTALTGKMLMAMIMEDGAVIILHSITEDAAVAEIQNMAIIMQGAGHTPEAVQAAHLQDI